MSGNVPPQDDENAAPVRAIEAGPTTEPSDSDEPAPAPRSSRRDTSRTRSESRTRGTSRSRPPSKQHGYASDYDVPARGLGSSRSSRPLRFREEYEEWSDPRDYDGRYWRDDAGPRRPEYRNRPRTHSRPPRSYLNNPDRLEEFDSGASPKPWIEETRSAYQGSVAGTPRQAGGPRVFDEEMGYTYGPPSELGTSPRDRPETVISGITLKPNGRIDFRSLSKEQRAEVMRLPWTHWMNSDFKNHFVASLGEFIGTTLFLFFAFAGTEVANIGSNVNPNDSSSSDSNTTTGGTTGFDVAVLLYISIIFGFSLMVNVWIFFRISGGLFNPAVTLAMVLVKAIPPVRALCLFISQMCGSLLASVIVRYLFPENFNVRTTLGGGATIVQGVFIEAILTAELVFTIFMLAKEKHRATFIAPVGIGLALFIAEMVGVQFTGGSLNPARSFGPCAVTATFDAEHYIYWVGPLLGSLIAVAFYKFIKILEYEMANPGADGDPSNDPTQNPEKRLEIRNSR